VRIRAYQLIDFQLFCQATVTPCYHRRGFRRVYLRQVMDPTWNGVSCHMIFRPAFAFEFYAAQSTIAATLEHIRLNLNSQMLKVQAICTKSPKKFRIN
jgi:hypothetical protein